MYPEKMVRDAVSAYFDAIRAGDAKAWVNTFAPDAVSHDPYGTPPNEGHDELRAFFDSLGDAFQHLAMYEENVFVAGNGAAVKWRGEGVGHTGKKVTFEGIDVFEINPDGTIQTVRAHALDRRASPY